MKRQIVCMFLALLLPAVMHAGIPVELVIQGADGKTPALAHAHLSELGQTYRQAIQVMPFDAQGRATLTVTEPGCYTLWITAVNHYATAVPLAIAKDQAELRLHITPRPYRYLRPVSTVRIIGDWNGFSFSAADTMVRQPDGTFTFEVRALADTLAYQLLGVDASGHSINGTMQDYFVYDGGGDYRSVIKTRKGERVRIVFDPQRLPIFKTNEPRLTVHPERPDLTGMFTLQARVDAMQDEYGRSLQAYRETHEDMKGFSFDASRYIDEFKQYLSDREHPIVRGYAAMALLLASSLRGARLDSTDYLQIARVLPADSPLWALGPFMIPAVVHYLGDKQGRAYMQQVIERNPVRRVRAHVLANIAMKARAQKDTATWHATFRQLKSEYSDLRDVQFYLTYLNPDQRVGPGKRVPDFEVTLMDTGEKVSSKSLLGRYYLLDFWATWCGPCVAELPEMHRVVGTVQGPEFCDIEPVFRCPTGRRAAIPPEKMENALAACVCGKGL